MGKCNERQVLTPIREYKNIVYPILERSQTNPDHLALIFLSEDGREEKVTIRQFHLKAAAHSLVLQAIGIGPEDLVILVLRHSRVLLYAFFGGVYLGAIPSIFPYLTEKLDPKI